MEKLARALLVVTALAMLVSWTMWASDQVAAGETVTITGNVLVESGLQDAEGRKSLLVRDEATLQSVRL